ncbi:MAG TPA: hypothetical protein VHY91_16005 [Pirellulales bacterium]|jgi:hypothetical protein|nr:hypothetical protein [Pirellulales bacterium]
MHPTPKLSVCLVAIGMGLLLVFCNSVWPEEAEKAKPSVKELQQKRLAILEQVVAIEKNLFQNARVSYDAILAAERELLAARIQYAETQTERIKACDEAIQEALAMHELLQARQIAARGLAVAVLQAEAYVLEAQIMRENAVNEK